MIRVEVETTSFERRVERGQRRCQKQSLSEKEREGGFFFILTFVVSKARSSESGREAREEREGRRCLFFL